MKMQYEKNVNRKLISELEKYGLKQWSNWVDDIVMHGVAYPINSFPEEGDVLKQMFEFLHENDIETFGYEKALALSLEKSLRTPSLSHRSERLIDALLYLDTEEAKSCLIDIIINWDIGSQKGKYDVLVSKAIQALARTKLSDKQIRIVYEQSFFYLQNQYKSLASFIGNFLRFIRVHKSLDKFWNILTFCIESQSADVGEKDKAKILAVLYDKVLELHFSNRGSFYSSMFYWWTDNLSHSSNNAFLKTFIGRVYKLLKSEAMISELEMLADESEEKAYGRALNFIIDINIQNPLDALSILDWERNLFFINKKSKEFLDSLKRTSLPNIINIYFEKSGSDVRLKGITRASEIQQTDEFKALIMELLLESWRSNKDKRTELQDEVTEGFKLKAI